MKFVRLRAALIVGFVAGAVASAAPAFAASPITNAFRANVEANIDFLGHSARLALDHSASAKVRDYAGTALTEADRIAQALVGVLPAGPAVATAEASEALMTGRSVAMDGAPAVPGQAANGRAPLGATDLAALGKLDGKRFADAFWLKQVDALSQLRADFRSYADDGDDPALAAMAERELPKIEARLALLTKI